MAIVSPVPAGRGGIARICGIEDPSAEGAFSRRAGCFAGRSKSEIDTVFDVVVVLQRGDVGHDLVRLLIANQRRRSRIAETRITGGAHDRRRWLIRIVRLSRPGIVFHSGLLKVVGSNDMLNCVYP